MKIKIGDILIDKYCNRIKVCNIVEGNYKLSLVNIFDRGVDRDLTLKEIRAQGFRKEEGFKNKGTLLSPLRRVFTNDKHIEFLFRCSCGGTIITKFYRFKSGLVKSCGCLRGKGIAGKRRVHGHLVGKKGIDSPEYTAWVKIKQRYSGEICSRWEKDFGKFYKDVGPKPKPKKNYCLIRLDKNKKFSPNNCRWGTNSEMSNLIYGNQKLTYNGATLSINEWAKKLNISESAFRSRLKGGWSEEQLFRSEKNINRASLGEVKVKDFRKISQLERDEQIKALREKGYSLGSIGNCFNLSKERIRQILIEVK